MRPEEDMKKGQGFYTPVLFPFAARSFGGPQRGLDAERLDNAIHVTDHSVAADQHTLTLVKAEDIPDEDIIVIFLVEKAVAQKVVVTKEPTIVNAMAGAAEAAIIATKSALAARIKRMRLTINATSFSL